MGRRQALCVGLSDAKSRREAAPDAGPANVFAVLVAQATPCITSFGRLRANIADGSSRSREAPRGSASTRNHGSESRAVRRNRPSGKLPAMLQVVLGGGRLRLDRYGAGGSSMDSSLRRVLRHLPFACPARAGLIVGLSWRVMMIRRKTAPGIRLGYFPEENSHGAFGEGHSVVRGSDLCCVRAHGRCPTSFECCWV